ncbi:hypothetical protein D4R71_02340 [bacterium]|nr:MAG: hypothetical protein D4R71_02340 [bacterium]
MKRFLFIVPIVILILLVACGGNGNGNGTGPDTQLRLKIEPSEQTIGVNATATFSVKIENAVDLFAFSGEIIFDSTLIELPENPVTEGEFWNSETLKESINEHGCLNVCIGLTQTSGFDGINGDGTLFYFTLIGVSTGVSSITINPETLELIDENSEPIYGFEEIEVSGGELTIE